MFSCSKLRDHPARHGRRPIAPPAVHIAFSQPQDRPVVSPTFDVKVASTMKTCGIFVSLVVFGTVPAQAQSDTSKVGVYGGYDYIRFNINANVSGVPPAESINLNGGSGQLEYNTSNKFGIVGDLGGYYGSAAGGGRGGRILEPLRAEAESSR